MRSTTWKKDLTVIGDFASDVGCPTPLFGLATTLHMATLAAGHGAEDSAAVCTTLQRMAGLKR
jgi:3-hydroxyisobutyrate dehydrogenase-like beta-hydroxyacid dehydrogenase